MLCPECQSEFHQDISFCEDCGVSLVAELPELQDIRWTSVKEYGGYIPAEMAKAALQNEGISSFIKGDFLSTAYGIKAWEAAGGKAVLFVPEKDMDRAMTILHEMAMDD